MSGQDEIKPHDGPEATENAFTLAFPKGDESFPVLKAFQEFLDAERERARRRQMTLTIYFMSTIVVLIVLFCGIGTALFSDMMRRNDTQQAQMLDILIQRMPTPRSEPQPVVAEQPTPQVSELLEVIKSLQAQNVEMMSALQKRIREPEPKVTPPAVPSPADTTDSARKTGIYSSPRRKPEPVSAKPSPVSAKPEPATQDEAGPDATAGATEMPEAPAVENKPEADEVPAEPVGPVKVKIIRTRDMHSPAGYTPEQITIVSSGNVKFPWRILMPTGTNTQEAL